VACGRYGEWSGAYRVLVGKPEGKRSLGRWDCNATLNCVLYKTVPYAWKGLNWLRIGIISGFLSTR